MRPAAPLKAALVALHYNSNTNCRQQYFTTVAVQQLLHQQESSTAAITTVTTATLNVFTIFYWQQLCSSFSIFACYRQAGHLPKSNSCIHH